MLASAVLRATRATALAPRFAASVHSQVSRVTPISVRMTSSRAPLKATPAQSLASKSMAASNKMSGLSALFIKPRGFLMSRLQSTTTISVPTPTKYPGSMVLLHWLIAAGFITCIATVKMAQWTPKENPKKYGYSKGELMMIHKSTAVLVAALVIPRVGLRLVQRMPALPEGSKFEHVMAKITHVYLYAMMVAMPGSGFAMAYFGGKGIPFFDTILVPGAEEPNKEMAGNAFKAHKQMGQILEYVIPLHMAAVAWHMLKAQNVLARMWF